MGAFNQLICGASHKDPYRAVNVATEELCWAMVVVAEDRYWGVAEKDGCLVVSMAMMGVWVVQMAAMLSLWFWWREYTRPQWQRTGAGRWA